MANEPIAWYDPSNGVVSTDQECPLFTPLGQVWALYPQPDQEPVAWMHEWEDGERIPLMYSSDSRDNDEPVSVRPLVYGDTTPPQRPWVDLSDSQIEQVYYDVAKLHRGAPMPWGQVQFGKALQALVKEKNYD